MVERSRACARWRVAVPIFLARVVVTSTQVFTLLSNSDIHKAPGGAEIPNNLLREAARGISPSLSFLFNFSLSHGKITSSVKAGKT